MALAVAALPDAIALVHDALGLAAGWDYATAGESDTRAMRTVELPIIAIPGFIVASLATASLARLAVTRRVSPVAAIAWGLAGLLAGGALFLFHGALDLVGAAALVWAGSGILVLAFSVLARSAREVDEPD